MKDKIYHPQPLLLTEGHFTTFYTELFGENPSQTLKTPYFQEDGILESCVERQEEMT